MLIHPFFRIGPDGWRNGALYAIDPAADGLRAIVVERGGRAVAWLDHDGGDGGVWEPHPWKTRLQDLIRKHLHLVLNFLNPQAELSSMAPRTQGSPLALYERAREEVRSLQACLSFAVRVELRFPQQSKTYRAKSITAQSAMSRSTARDTPPVIDHTTLNPCFRLTPNEGR